MTILTIAQAQPSLVPSSSLPIVRYPARNVRSGPAVSPLGCFRSLGNSSPPLREGTSPYVDEWRVSPVGIPFHGKYYIPSHIHFHFANRTLDRPASCELVGHPLGGVRGNDALFSFFLFFLFRFLAVLLLSSALISRYYLEGFELE